METLFANEGQRASLQAALGVAQLLEKGETGGREPTGNGQVNTNIGFKTLCSLRRKLVANPGEKGVKQPDAMRETLLHASCALPSLHACTVSSSTRLTRLSLAREKNFFLKLLFVVLLARR